VRLQVILRNIFSNWVGYLVTVTIGFFLSPFVVHHLGKSGYGVWTLVVSVTGYFGVLDLGLRQSVGRFVVRHIALKDAEGVNRTITTALAMLAIAGSVALLATGVLYFSFGAFKVEHGFEAAAKGALLIAGFNASMVIPFAVFSSILIALERYDVINAITVLGAITRATLAVAALRMGYGLVALALLVMAVSTLEYTIMAISAKRLYPPLKIQWRYASLATCRSLFSFGIYRFLWIIANQLIFYTDSVVIGLFLGASEITYFAIAGSLITYGRNVVSLASDAFYPTAARLDSENDLAGLRKLYFFGTTVTLLVGLPICLGFLFLGKQFVTLWMGKDYAISAFYLAILTIPQFTSLPQYISAHILVGMARHKFLAKAALAEGVVNLILSIVLVRKIGLVGVAWGTVVPHLITATIVIPLYTLRTLGASAQDYLVKGYLRPVICAIPTAAVAFAMNRWVEHASWIGFAGEGFGIVAIFGVQAYFICLTMKQREAVKERILKLIGQRLPEKAVAMSVGATKESVQ
jgi:O-antigen/teichoic acid export membrane protein